VTSTPVVRDPERPHRVAVFTGILIRYEHGAGDPLDRGFRRHQVVVETTTGQEESEARITIEADDPTKIEPLVRVDRLVRVTVELLKEP
jgi:hypothetical protein